jgi:hypothetical protein
MIPHRALEVRGMNQFSSTPRVLVSRSWHCWSSGGALAQRSAAQARDRGCRTLALIGIPFRNYMERRSGKQGNPEDHSE